MWRLFPFLMFILTAGSARADPCGEAIAAAERAHSIPPRLLAAIGRVESGRRDASTGALVSWPWTINADGQGNYYGDKAQAVAAAKALRPKITTSLDVGCMQISLTAHPNAFPSLETAFDPVANADYGARFLMELFQKTNSWPKAVELYHSGTPAIGQPYRQKVYAALAGLPVAMASGWGMPSGRSIMAIPPHPPAPHFIWQAPGAVTPLGHTLDFYRSAPVRLARTP